MGCAALGYCYTLQDKVVRPAARCALLEKVCKERGAKWKCVMSPQSMYLLKLAPFFTI